MPQAAQVGETRNPGLGFRPAFCVAQARQAVVEHGFTQQRGFHNGDKPAFFVGDGHALRQQQFGEQGPSQRELVHAGAVIHRTLLIAQQQKQQLFLQA